MRAPGARGSGSRTNVWLRPDDVASTIPTMAASVERMWSLDAEVLVRLRPKHGWRFS